MESTTKSVWNLRYFHCNFCFLRIPPISFSSKIVLYGIVLACILISPQFQTLLSDYENDIQRPKSVITGYKNNLKTERVDTSYRLYLAAAILILALLMIKFLVRTYKQQRHSYLPGQLLLSDINRPFSNQEVYRSSSIPEIVSRT